MGMHNLFFLDGLREFFGPWNDNTIHYNKNEKTRPKAVKSLNKTCYF